MNMENIPHLAVEVDGKMKKDHSCSVAGFEDGGRG
jgi:hypothetical protein